MKSKTEENKNKYLTEAEVRKLITQTKGGDNSAKAALYENYKNYMIWSPKVENSRLSD